MGRAELLKAISKLVDSLRSGANDHAEEPFFKKACAREGKTVLFIQKFLAEVNIVGDSLKFLEVNSHHHVHRGAWLNRCYTSDCG